MSGLSALRRSGRFIVMVSRPRSRFWRTISFALMAFLPSLLDYEFRRHCEERSDEAIQGAAHHTGLLRFARNDGGETASPGHFFTNGQREASSGWNASFPATVPSSL